jgi:hypothetical protein
VTSPARQKPITPYRFDRSFQIVPDRRAIDENGQPFPRHSSPGRVKFKAVRAAARLAKRGAAGRMAATIAAAPTAKPGEQA